MDCAFENHAEGRREECEVALALFVEVRAEGRGEGGAGFAQCRHRTRDDDFDVVRGVGVAEVRAVFAEAVRAGPQVPIGIHGGVFERPPAVAVVFSVDVQVVFERAGRLVFARDPAARFGGVVDAPFDAADVAVPRRTAADEAAEIRFDAVDFDGVRQYRVFFGVEAPAGAAVRQGRVANHAPGGHERFGAICRDDVDGAGKLRFGVAKGMLRPGDGTGARQHARHLNERRLCHG